MTATTTSRVILFRDVILIPPLTVAWESSGSPTDTPETDFHQADLHSTPAQQTECRLFLGSVPFMTKYRPENHTPRYSRGIAVDFFRQHQGNSDTRRHAGLHQCSIDLVQLNTCLEDLFLRSKSLPAGDTCQGSDPPFNCITGQCIKSYGASHIGSGANGTQYHRRCQ